MKILNTLTISMYDPDALVPIADHITVTEAKELVSDVISEKGEIMSNITVPEIAEVLTQRLGLKMNVGKRHIVFNAEDEAIVIRYNGPRLNPGDVIDPALMSYYYVRFYPKDAVHVGE